MQRYLIPTTSYPHKCQVSTDASEAATPQVAESTATAQTPLRTTCILKSRSYNRFMSVQDSLDFDKILNEQVPRQLPDSFEKRNVSLTAFGALVLLIGLTPICTTLIFRIVVAIRRKRYQPAPSSSKCALLSLGQDCVSVSWNLDMCK